MELTTIHTNTQHGLIAQNKAELRAIEKGYIISKPITECCRYDMILDAGEKLERIQVKYAGSKPGHNIKGSATVDFRKKSINGKMRNGYYENEIDAILVYIPDIDKICYFPINFIAGKTSLTIRYDKTKNSQVKGIIFADDYVW